MTFGPLEVFGYLQLHCRAKTLLLAIGPPPPRLRPAAGLAKHHLPSASACKGDPMTTAPNARSRSSSNKCIASSNRCLTTSNKKLLETCTTSKAPVTTSVALVSNSFLLLLVRLPMHGQEAASEEWGL